MRIKASDRVLIVGKTRSGKTYLASKLIGCLKRVLIYDPLNRVNGPYATDREIDEFIEGKYLKIKIGTQPKFEEIIEDSFDYGWYTVYVDELYSLVPSAQSVVPSLTRIVTMGAGQQIGLIACCQRPARLPVYLFSECEHFFIFRLNYPDDRLRIWEIAGYPEQPNVSSEHPHGFYYIDTRADKVYYIHKVD